MMKKLLLLVILIAMSYTATAQNVGINESGTAPDASAVLDVQSSDKGVLFPRLTTTERDAIQNPANFLIILNTTSECLEIYNAGNSSWTEFGCLWNCGNVINDMRDGNIYKTIQIGNQCWMAENLNYAASGSWCSSNNSSNCNTYGRLYDWNTAMVGSGSSSLNPSGVQGVCPTGWHLPSDVEWQEMEMELGMSSGDASSTGGRGTTQGTQLKTSSWGGDNNSGFTALPGGGGSTNGSFNNVGSVGLWWSATEDGADAWRRRLNGSDAIVNRNTSAKGFGYSVRCVRDATPCSTAVAPTTMPASNIGETTFDANWQVVSGATTYYLDVSDDAGFSNLIVNNQNVGNVTSYSVSSGLTCNTSYYYRVRAENACGVGANSGTETLTTGSCPWTCGDAFTDTRDTKTYSTVQIGSQCWMSENLAYLPVVHNNSQFQTQGNNSQAGYGVYNYNGTNVTTAKNEANYSTYGVLYNWWAAMDGASSSNNNPSGVQGVCPTGWHLPSDVEWQEMEIALGMSSGDASSTGWRGTTQGTQLKDDVNWNGNNNSGFTALPGGYRFTFGSFNNVGSYGYWWSATDTGANVWQRNLRSSYATVYRLTNAKGHGFSVRCVRD